MSKILSIGQMPTSLEWEYINANKSCSGFHESLFRSYHILEEIKEHLQQNEKISSALLLEIISAMEAK